MNGLEAARRIRTWRRPDTKIVIVSAFAFTEYRNGALAAGVGTILGPVINSEAK